MSSIADVLLDARAALERGDLEAAEALYARALQREPALASALRGRAEIALKRNDPATALGLVEASLGAASAYVPSQSKDPMRVLQLGSIHPHAHANTDRVLNPLWTETTTLLVEKWDLAWELPPHDILFNVIADADIALPALELAARLVEGRRPVLNAPAAVALTSRVENASRLAGIDGLKMAKVALVARTEVPAISGFPYLLRAPGFHNGANFEMVRDAADRDRALQALPGDALLHIEYLETRLSDGAFRKYRAMCVDGILHPAHLAIGDVWKLHYFSSTMTEERREEERSYLRDMRAHLGSRAYAALAEAARRMNLDYCGMDFTLDADGVVALFEANASMTVFLPEDTASNAYRREAVFAIDAALQELIVKRTGRV